MLTSKAIFILKPATDKSAEAFTGLPCRGEPPPENTPASPVGEENLRTLFFFPGQTLAQAVYLSGAVAPKALCSGIGRCGRCRVLILKKPPEPAPKDLEILGKEDVELGWRLGCAHSPVTGMVFSLPTETDTNEIRTEEIGIDKPDATQGQPWAVESKTGGTDKSKAKRHDKTDGTPYQAQSRESGSQTPRSKPYAKTAFLGIDLGTTSIAWQAVSENGCELFRGSILNPQMGAGSEVISRLHYARTAEGAATLQRLVTAALEKLPLPGQGNTCPEAEGAKTKSRVAPKSTCSFLPPGNDRKTESGQPEPHKGLRATGYAPNSHDKTPGSAFVEAPGRAPGGPLDSAPAEASARANVEAPGRAPDGVSSSVSGGVSDREALGTAASDRVPGEALSSAGGAAAHPPGGASGSAESEAALKWPLEPDERDVKICIAANPTMTALLLGLDVSGLAFAPYRLPLKGGETRLSPVIGRVWIPPQLSPFVGGDLSAGYAAVTAEGENPEFPFVLADMGTNGEFILALSPDKAICTSVALGPALEGVGLGCGTEARPGAITAFEYTPVGFKPIYFEKTPPVGGPVGITGTGYLSLVSLMLRHGIIDRDGQPGNTGKPLPLLPDGLRITATDIEEILKVKAAFSLGLKRLLEVSGLTVKDLNAIHLAGALGQNTRDGNLEELGFIPPGLGKKVVFSGNTSLRGALLLASDIKARERLTGWAQNIIPLDLANDQNFMDRYIHEMHFNW